MGSERGRKADARSGGFCGAALEKIKGEFSPQIILKNGHNCQHFKTGIFTLKKEIHDLHFCRVAQLTAQHCLGPFRWSLLSLYLWQAEGWGGLLPLVTDQPTAYCWRQMNLHKWFRCLRVHTHTRTSALWRKVIRQRATTEWMIWHGSVPLLSPGPSSGPHQDHTRWRPHTENTHSPQQQLP